MQPNRPVLIAIMCTLFVSGYAAARGGGEPFTLQLLHFADIDGDETAALENLDAFSALVAGFRNDPRYGANTIVVSSGDNSIPGPRYFAAEQRAVREITGSNEPGHADHVIMRHLGVVASAIGNHELDQGPAEFADAFIGDDLAPGFPYLAANIDFSREDDLVIGAAGADYTELAGHVAASTTVRIDGQLIGIVGATTPALDTITSVGRLAITGGGSGADLAAAIQPVVDALVERGVNKIVVLAHMQRIAIERELAELLSGVDIIVAGGSNTLLADADDELRPGDRAVDTYPLQFRSPTGEPVLVVNVDGDYRYLGRLVVTFDDRGIIEVDALDRSLNGAWASTPANAAAVGGAPIPEVVAVRDALREVITTQFGNVVGYTDVYLEGGRAAVRTEETNLGNLTADANLWYANRLARRHVAVSIKNGGGIRTAIGQAIVPAGSAEYSDVVFNPPPNGGVSEGHLRATLRFDNGLVLLDVSAAELKDVLEHAVAAAAPGVTPGGFPQVAGLSFGYDPNATARVAADDGSVATPGARIQNLVVLDADGRGTRDVVVAGGSIQGDPDRTFRIVTLNFLANGGDGYPFPALASPNRSQLYAAVGYGDPDLADDGVPDFPVEPQANDPGRNGGFSYTGGEQDALAEYLAAFHPTAGAAYRTVETARAEDRRVQDVSVRNWVAP